MKIVKVIDCSDDEIDSTVDTLVPSLNVVAKEDIITKVVAKEYVITKVVK